MTSAIFDQIHDLIIFVPFVRKSLLFLSVSIFNGLKKTCLDVCSGVTCMIWVNI